MAKVLIYSPNLIGKSMAGASIRPWEFAKVLSKDHDVVLISQKIEKIESQPFEIVSLHDPKCSKHFKDAHVLIAQRLTFPLALRANLNRVRIIIDAYVPGPLELLEHFKSDATFEREGKILSETSNIILSFKLAEGILCASEKQRELWLGFLMGQKLITPALYDRDSNLRNFLSVVPFGLPNSSPRKNGAGIKEKFGLKAADQILLWGGGIWNWFDPLSLIRAIKKISQERSNIKLIFMGVKPPDPNLPATAMSAQAIQLAKDLNLINQSVFFNHEWVPYEERQNFLLDATLGVSTHSDHLETQFSFRTRILDYLWAGLPILTTEGDSFAELVKKHQLGLVVPYHAPEAIAQAILSMVDQPDQMRLFRSNISRIREQFYWSSVTHPLSQMIDRLSSRRSENHFLQNGMSLFNFGMNKLRERGLKACASSFYKQFMSN